MKAASGTPRAALAATILTVTTGLALGFTGGLLVTEEHFNVMMDDWKYIVCLLLAVLLPPLVSVLGNLVPLFLSRRLAAVWWLGRGRYKDLAGKWQSCGQAQASAFVVFPFPPDNLQPDSVDAALELHRHRLWRGVVWAILMLLLPVAYLIYMASGTQDGLPWPVYVPVLLYLLSLTTLIVSSYTERNGVSGALRQARQLKQNRLWALANLWAELRLHYPQTDVAWLNHLCLEELMQCDLNDKLNLIAADWLLTDRLAFYKNEPCPAPIMRVVRDATSRPEAIFALGGESVLPLLYHIIHGFAVAESTRATAENLFDTVVALSYDTEVWRYNIMQTEHILHEANHGRQLADETQIAPFVGYAYYTCFPQFFAVQKALSNRQDEAPSTRRKPKPRPDVQ